MPWPLQASSSFPAVATRKRRAWGYFLKKALGKSTEMSGSICLTTKRIGVWGQDACFLSLEAKCHNCKLPPRHSEGFPFVRNFPPIAVPENFGPILQGTNFRPDLPGGKFLAEFLREKNLGLYAWMDSRIRIPPVTRRFTWLSVLGFRIWSSGRFWPPSHTPTRGSSHRVLACQTDLFPLHDPPSSSYPIWQRQIAEGR